MYPANYLSFICLSMKLIKKNKGMFNIKFRIVATFGREGR